MGQQNQKIHIKHIQDEIPVGQRKRDKYRRIFNKGHYVAEPVADLDHPMYCDRPHCHCPLRHFERDNLKLCDNCNKLDAPTIYKNKKASYSTASVFKGQQNQSGFKQRKYEQPNIVEKQQPITYYNGWSLPTQKIYTDKIQRQFKPRNAIDISIDKIMEKTLEIAMKPPSPQKVPAPMEQLVEAFIPIQKPPPKPTLKLPSIDEIDINSRVNNLFYNL